MIKSGQCSLQKLRENLPESTDLESRIKKTKRFLISKYTDYQSFYLPHLELLFRWLKDKDWFLIIDGSMITWRHIHMQGTYNFEEEFMSNFSPVSIAKMLDMDFQDFLSVRNW